MSRIGKLPIPVPTGVEVAIKDRLVSVKGPKGSLEWAVTPPMAVSRGDDGTIVIHRPDEERKSRELHGLTRTLVANMVTGVTEGYQRRLEIVGVGYRAQARGSAVEFSLGYSHTITVDPPEGITLTVESPTRLTVSGIDKQQVGEVAANIRKLRKPEPYKGKGIRYEGEQVRRKVGKAGK